MGDVGEKEEKTLHGNRQQLDISNWDKNGMKDSVALGFCVAHG